jgi:hypothetical protein
MGKSGKGKEKKREEEADLARKISRVDLLEDEDAGSSVDLESAMSDEMAITSPAEDATEGFSEALEDLTNSSSGKRLKALQAMLKILRSGIDLSDYLLNYRTELCGALLWILRRQVAETECVLAVQISCIFALIVGPDDDDYFETFNEALKTAVTRRYYLI